MELKDNPLLQPEDYFSSYNEQIERLKNDPNLVSFEKLCYEVFSTEMGKKFMEHVETHFIWPALADRNSPHYKLLVIWADGFKDFPRMIKQSIISHDQRIKAGAQS